jgi:hypothetical protein
MVVCLTFDDGCLSHYEFVRPLLKEAGLAATFFICGTIIDKPLPGVGPIMSWEQVIELGKDFELGNHTYRHGVLHEDSVDVRDDDIAAVPLKLEMEMASFCYPGYAYDVALMRDLAAKGYTHARSGCEKTLDWERFQEGGSGSPYNIVFDNPMNVQCLGVFGGEYGVTEFEQDLERIGPLECGVFSFHGVTNDQPNTSISEDNFKRCVDYIVAKGIKTVPMQDIDGEFSFSQGGWDACRAYRKKQGSE